MQLSDYVTIVVCVPQTHADALRQAMGKAGAGKVGHYSYCSFSSQGIGRYIPHQGSCPHVGQENALQEVIEERIEAVCSRAILEEVLQVIKKAHPYEEMVIDIYPIYEVGRKKAKL